MSRRNDITLNTPDLALDLYEAELSLDLIDRAVDHFDYIAATADLDDHTRDTYRRMLMRDALKHALVTIKHDRLQWQQEVDQHLCVGGGR